MTYIPSKNKTFTPVSKVSIGDKVCYKNGNGNWYEGVVIDENGEHQCLLSPEKKSGIVVDYGNISAIQSLDKLFTYESVLVVHPHPLVEMRIKNFKNDDVGYLAECVLYNKEFKKVESSFFLTEDVASEIIYLMQEFLDNCVKTQNKSMKLSLEIIRSYGLKERFYKPDWDDTCIEITLPNGIELSAMTQCNNLPTKSNSLEGLDGYLYIETKEELDELIGMTYEQVIQKLASENEDFDADDYLPWS